VSLRRRLVTGLRRSAVRASVVAYRILLLRYPEDMRRGYGAEMVELFAAEVERHVAERGFGGLAAVWWRTLRDVVRPLPGPILDEEHRRARGWGISEDVAFATRSLVREPRFTALVVGVLAVGIALNTSAFAVLNAYVLRPLPFPEADRLMRVRGGDAVSWTEVDEVFEVAASWDLDVFTLLGDGRPEVAPGAWITPGFLELYGVQPALGRGFRPEEVGRDGAPVAMISHRLWQERFGGDPGVIGRGVSAFTSDRPDHAELFTIVGVLPADFWYLNEYTEVLVPIRVERAVYTGRLRADVPSERAEAILTEMATRRMEEVPPGFRVEVLPVQELHAASVRPTLLALQAAVLLVLLIACANAAVLLLVRSTRRERELGVRRALGASSARLARQLLLEGGLLAGAAAVLGVGMAALGLGVARSTIAAQLGRSVPGGADALVIDATVLTAAVAVAAGVGLVFGAVPMVTSLGRRGTSGLAESRRGGGESRTRRRARSAMVAAEVALSLSLLTGAGLMVRSAWFLQNRPLGFEPTNVVRAQLGLREATYPDLSARVEAFTTLAERLEALPGVERVGLASSALFGTRFGPWTTEGLDGDQVRRGEAIPWIVDERYFDAMDIRILRGRGFTEEDAAGTEPVAVVSERLARDLFGDADPLGLGVRVPPFTMPGSPRADSGPWLRIVGVVSDIERDVGGTDVGDVYAPLRQENALWVTVYVRQRAGSASVVSELERVVHELDPNVPVASVTRLDEVVEQAMQPTRWVAALLTGFSAFALLLAVLGLYGVVSYAARQRRRDVAVRVALGADRASVTSLFVRQGLVVVALGIVVGTWGGYLLGRVLEAQLHGIEPGDPATHALLAGVLAVTAAMAVWLPARRAAKADPMGVLREE
jgi:putative ABC transport system permease protein